MTTYKISTHFNYYEHHDSILWFLPVDTWHWGQDKSKDSYKLTHSYKPFQEVGTSNLY